jgi:hypothetical protein
MLVCRWCNARQPLSGSVRCSACRLPICNACRRCQGKCASESPRPMDRRPLVSRRPVPTKRKPARKAVSRSAAPGLRPGVIRELVSRSSFAEDCGRLEAEAKHRLDLRRRAAQALAERGNTFPHALGDPSAVVRAPDRLLPRENRLVSVTPRPGPERTGTTGRCLHGVPASDCRLCAGPGRFRRRYAGGPEGFR